MDIRDLSFPVSADQKRCGKCKQVLSRSAFYKNRARSDGLDTYCKPCNVTYQTQHRDPDKYREQCRRNAKKRRMDLLEELGGSCACCGESTYEFLQFDHVEGDGADHRRFVGHKAISTSLIRKWGIEKFQILCANCNFAKGSGTSCPHSLEKEVLLIKTYRSRSSGQLVEAARWDNNPATFQGQPGVQNIELPRLAQWYRLIVLTESHSRDHASSSSVLRGHWVIFPSGAISHCVIVSPSLFQSEYEEVAQ